MNEQIINNLYELWEQIGNMTNKLSKTENYSIVSMGDSDWPNRIFNLKNDTESFFEIFQLSKEGRLPEMLTINEPMEWSDNPNLQFVMSQKNMAIDMKLISKDVVANPNVKQVMKEKDAIDFAETASKSFGYKVDSKVIYTIVQNSETIRLFLYQEGRECVGCGIVFFDSRNNAGVHMIGTLPKARGKGIGKSITEKLLIEVKMNNADYCVLHASLMGESIYKKLGFKPYGRIETYKILKNRNN